MPTIAHRLFRLNPHKKAFENHQCVKLFYRRTLTQMLTGRRK